MQVLLLWISLPQRLKPPKDFLLSAKARQQAKSRLASICIGTCSDGGRGRQRFGERIIGSPHMHRNLISQRVQ